MLGTARRLKERPALYRKARLGDWPSDLRAKKSAPYKKTSYEMVLERDAGSYMSNTNGVSRRQVRDFVRLYDTKQTYQGDFSQDLRKITSQR